MTMYKLYCYYKLADIIIAIKRVDFIEHLRWDGCYQEICAIEYDLPFILQLTNYSGWVVANRFSLKYIGGHEIVTIFSFSQYAWE